MLELISKNNFKKKAFFLDRDGILNKLVENRPPWKISEISLFNEAHEIIKIIKSKNYLPIVVTNQPDEARGKLFVNTDSINQNICTKLELEHYYICKHPYDGICNCRKPKPGMLLKASKDLNIDISKSFLLGDRAKDIKAGESAGCLTILLRNKKICKSNFHVYNNQELIYLLRNIL